MLGFLALEFMLLSLPGVREFAALMTQGWNWLLVLGAFFVVSLVAAFMTRADFSFLRGVLVIGGLVALGLIVASIFFGFTLGVIFLVVMLGFAAAILISLRACPRALWPDLQG